MSKTFISIIVAVVVIVGIFVIVNVANDMEGGGTGTAGTRTCSTRCTWFTEKRCEDGATIGACFPSWGCGDGLGLHTCVAENGRNPANQVASARSVPTADRARASATQPRLRTTR